MSAEGFDDSVEENMTILADAVQCETTALFARGQAAGRGVRMERGHGPHGFKPRASSLSIEDRRKKLVELKSKSTCKACGKRGHWAGDPGCTGVKKKAVGHMAIS